MRSIEEVFQETTMFAMRSLREDGFVVCTVSGWREGDGHRPSFVASSHEGPGGSDEAMVLRQQLLLNHVVLYSFCCEAWVSHMRPVKGKQVRDMPDAKDGVHVLAATPDRVLLQGFQIYVDNDGRRRMRPDSVVPLDTARGEVAAGRWATLLAPTFDPTGRHVTIPPGKEGALLKMMVS